MDEKKKPLRGFDLSRLKNSTDEVIKDRTLSEGFKAPVKGVTEHIKTKVAQPLLSGADFTEKIAAKRAALQAAKTGGKKLAGILPFAGAAYGLMSGDPAMAAEEAAGDIPILGQAYEAIRPEVAGNPEEERQMLAERNAQVDYQNSPAHLAKLEALKKLR